MLRFSCVVVGLLLVASSATAGELKLDVRRRVEDAEKRGTFKTVESQQTVDAARTAIVIVDMWDDHHCKSAAARVGEMAPHMNKTIAAARKRGVLIVHAPSGCMDFYKETPQRKRAQQAKLARSGVKFQWNYFNSKHEGPLADKLEKAGCSCDSPEPCGPSYRAWKRQTAGLEIAAEDAVSDNGQEIFNLLGERKIDNVILMGVHTNRCVFGRPFGIRQMSYLGKKVY